MKYVIMADSNNSQAFKMPRQLTKINGEPLVARTIRLLKENGLKDIFITSHDKRFDNFGATRYEPKNNNHEWNNGERKGYWLDAFTWELLTEPITFLFGDVYYSENAIKTIVGTETKENLFFCTYQNKNKKYIKEHDEPLAYKVVDTELFKKHIKRVKKLFDQGKTVRHPLVWELYRSMNGQNINIHTMTKNYVAINDESCDIDEIDDIILLKEKLGGENMVKVEVIKEFTLGEFDKLKNITRKKRDEKGKLFEGDTFECTNEMAEYLSGKNMRSKKVIEIIEVIPEKKEEPKEEKKPVKKTTKKKTSKK